MITYKEFKDKFKKNDPDALFLNQLLHEEGVTKCKADDIDFSSDEIPSCRACDGIAFHVSFGDRDYISIKCVNCGWQLRVHEGN